MCRRKMLGVFIKRFLNKNTKSKDVDAIINIFYKIDGIPP